MPIKKNAKQTGVPEALMNAFSPTREHLILARLSGIWLVEGEWYLNPKEPAALGGNMLNQGILGGHFIESSSIFDGEEKSRVIYGFDPEDGRYFAFAINGLAARYDLEHGYYDDATDSLRFSCTEYVGAKRIPVKFERTISFLPTSGFNMEITYPEFEPDRRLGMALRMRIA